MTKTKAIKEARRRVYMRKGFSVSKGGCRWVVCTWDPDVDSYRESHQTDYWRARRQVSENRLWACLEFMEVDYRTIWDRLNTYRNERTGTRWTDYVC